VCVCLFVCLFVFWLSVRSHMSQEAQLPQRDRATRYISKFCYFTRYGSEKGFKQRSYPWRSFKGIGNCAIDRPRFLISLSLQLGFYLAPLTIYYHLFQKI